MSRDEDDLTDDWERVSVLRLFRTDDDEHDGGTFGLVDRGELTDRQADVLRTAHEMGYFDRPRDANGSDVADELEISPSTFREHLTAAQRKLLSSILDS